MIAENLKKYIISTKYTVRDSVKRMDIEGVEFLVVVEKNKRVVGVFTMGDFRRAVLSGLDINEKISTIINKDFLWMNEGFTRDDSLRLFEKDMVNNLPVLDNGELIDIVHKKDIKMSDDCTNKNVIWQLPVVIMAGGKGTRLDPFTRILPKPLIPLGNDPIIKVIMDEFSVYGLKEFYVTLNDKGKMIKAYFQDHNLKYNLNFLEEEKPFGTGGSLKLLQGKLGKTFFVSNCDIIIKCNYDDIYKFHMEKKNEITLVGSMQHYKIPYGVCEIRKGGDLISIREKPEYDFLTNTGLYLLEPKVLSYIPDDIYFDMTDLINVIQDEGLKVGVFPISEKSWIDVGQWAEYQKVIKEIGY